MNPKQLLAVLLAALVVSAGAGVAAAASGTDTQGDAQTSATVDASYDNGTVSLTVDQNGSAVENATVYANDAEVGTTDENGSVTFETTATDEFAIEVVGDNLSVERTYAIENGSLVLQEDTETGTETGSDATVEATYDNGSVSVTVTRNDSGVENATVYANGDEVGTTDANGSVTFETNASEELELKVVGEEFTVEHTYAIEDGSLVLQEEEDGDAHQADENASDTAHTVLGVIQSWINGDREGNLGKMIQDALGHDGHGKADEHRPDDAGKASEDHGQSENAANASADEHAEEHGKADAEHGKNDDHEAKQKDDDDDDDDQKEDDGDDAEDDDSETEASVSVSASASVGADA